MSKQQTAVEWLIEQLYPALKLNSKWIDEFVGYALEMEKQQIIKSNRDGVDMCVDKKPFITGEQYYSEKYKK